MFTPSELRLYQHAQDHSLLTLDILGCLSVFGDILGQHLISTVYDEPADESYADTQILCDCNVNVACETGIHYPTLQAMLNSILQNHVVRNRDGCTLTTLARVEW